MNSNPVKSYYRADPLLLLYLLENKLKPTSAMILFYFMLCMDRENMLEVSEKTLNEHLHNRFKIDRKNLIRYVGAIQSLGLIVKLSPKAIRINPWLANRCQNLSGFWEFSDIKLNPLGAEYHEWLCRNALPAGMPSYRRLKAFEQHREKLLKKYVLMSQHIEIVENFKRQIQLLIDEQSDDVLNYLETMKQKDQEIESLKIERKERDMRIEKLEGEIIKSNLEKDDIARRSEITMKRFEMKMDNYMKQILAELRKQDVDKAEKMLLTVINGGRGKASAKSRKDDEPLLH
jgi:hypothetical protein